MSGKIRRNYWTFMSIVLVGERRLIVPFGAQQSPYVRLPLLEEGVMIGQYQRVPQNLIHMLDRDDRDVLEHLSRNFLDVLFVLLRNHNGLNAATMSRHDLFLQA